MRSTTYQGGYANVHQDGTTPGSSRAACRTTPARRRHGGDAVNPRWMETAALVLVFRSAVEAFGKRGSWVAAQRLQRAGMPMLLSPDFQRALDHAADDGLLTIPAGSTVPRLTSSGLVYLRDGLTDRQRVALIHGRRTAAGGRI